MITYHVMSDSRADLLLHPVRIRIVQAAAGREVTTRQLAEDLRDVPPATLYRHVARLADAGVLEVVRTRRVRGSVERTFTLVTEAASLGPQDLASVPPEAHLDPLTAFVGAVLERATAYLRSPGADPAGDGFSYRQVALWLTDDELARVLDAVRAPLRAAAANGPAEGRRRRVLTTILIPDVPTGPSAADT